MEEKKLELDVIVNDTFIELWRSTAYKVHETAKEKGWWNKYRSEGEIIALIHSELSEALEAIRECKLDDKIPDFLGVEAELADVVIRIMDYAFRFDYRVAEAVIAKMEYNKTREKMHGGKKF